jgi:hypothetical protein
MEVITAELSERIRSIIGARREAVVSSSRASHIFLELRMEIKKTSVKTQCVLRIQSVYCQGTRQTRDHGAKILSDNLLLPVTMW